VQLIPTEDAEWAAVVSYHAWVGWLPLAVLPCAAILAWQRLAAVGIDVGPRPQYLPGPEVVVVVASANAPSACGVAFLCLSGRLARHGCAVFSRRPARRGSRRGEEIGSRRFQYDSGWLSPLVGGQGGSRLACRCCKDGLALLGLIMVLHFGTLQS